MRDRLDELHGLSAVGTQGWSRSLLIHLDLQPRIHGLSPYFWGGARAVSRGFHRLKAYRQILSSWGSWLRREIGLPPQNPAPDQPPGGGFSCAWQRSLGRRVWTPVGRGARSRRRGDRINAHGGLMTVVGTNAISCFSAAYEGGFGRWPGQLGGSFSVSRVLGLISLGTGTR
jgi:hypothetical protein